MSISVVASALELERHCEAWDVLASQAVQRNIFYESWMLLPALRGLAGTGVSVVLVWDPVCPQRLLGLFPLQRLLRFKGFLPVQHWSTWRHPYCYLGVPLVHQDAVAVCLGLFFAWCDEQGGLAITFSHIYQDELYAELQRYVVSSRRCVNVFDQHARALLRSSLTGDQYLVDAISKKRRKEYARLQRRLEDVGAVEFMAFDAAQHDFDLWLECFFRLEQQGWKGQEGTALALDARGKAFAVDVVRAAAGLGRLQMFQLCLQGQPVAALLMFMAGDRAYAFKIAYDEAFGQYSPGVLLMLDVTRQCLDQRPGVWVDSCAAPGHPMIDHIWRQRLEMLSPQVGLRHLLARPVFAALKVMKYFRNMMHRKNGYAPVVD